MGSVVHQKALRRSAIAYVYPENPPLRREDKLAFYDKVTASGVEIPGFSIQGPEMVMTRPPSPATGSAEVRVGPYGPQSQLRLVIVELLGERPVELSRENADLIWEAFLGVWGSKISQPALTEVTLTFTAPAPGGSATTFLREKVADLGSSAMHQLGREFQGFGLRFMSGPAMKIGDGGADISLPGAEVQVKLETLQEDVSQVFVEVLARWPAITLPKDRLPPQLSQHVDGPFFQVNPKAESPKHYLSAVYQYVETRILAFLEKSQS